MEDDIEEEANSHQYIMKNFRIARCEYTRFIIFGIMFGIIGFIYSFMRIIKDTYVMVRQDPNCILYLKIFYILPLSFGVVLLINYMLTTRTLARIFSIFCIGFMVLFFVFGLVVLFEEAVFFDPSHIRNQFALCKLDARGLGFTRYFLLTINEPLATLVYITAELWGSLMLSYLFLSFLNEACTRRQHARFLPPLFIVANIALLLSALSTTMFFKVRGRLTFEQNTMLMAGVFFIEGSLTLALLFCKYLLERRIMVVPIFREEHRSGADKAGDENADKAGENGRTDSRTSNKSKGKKQQKSELGFAEGLEIMSQSKFLLAMSTIVFFFSVLSNILETVYKIGVKRGAEILGYEKGAYSGWYNNLDQYITSLTVIALNLSSFSNLVSSIGWLSVAVISPIVAAIASVCILGIASYNAGAEEASVPWVNAALGGARQALRAENYLGMLCLASMKIFKFTAFDVTKERISMRIEDRYRPKFKSVFDGIFNKFGKSFGAFYGIAANLVHSNIDIRGMAPVTALFAIPFIAAWVAAVLYLAHAYNEAEARGGCVDIDLAEEEDTQEERDVHAKKEAKSFKEAAARGLAAAQSCE